MDVAVELSRHNQLDAYWLSEAQLRCLEEKLIHSWETDLAEVTPEVLDERLAGDATTMHRVSWVEAARVEVLLRMRGCLVGLESWANHIWVGVAAPDVRTGREVLERLRALFPEPAQEELEAEVHLSIWSSDGARGGTAVGRELEVRPWGRIADNYAPRTRGALEPLMEGFEPDGSGRLLLFHGAPGTGKSTALAAMGFAWRGWARMHYVADPEELLSRPPYLFDLALRRHTGDRWRVVVLEDSGELFAPDAKHRVGQGLSRLLNVTDGMLGQGSRVLFVISTNEPLEHLHEAVARPGRCAAAVEFLPLPAPQAREWLVAKGAVEVARTLSGPATLAELYGRLHGWEPDDKRITVGFAAGA